MNRSYKNPFKWTVVVPCSVLLCIGVFFLQSALCDPLVRSATIGLDGKTEDAVISSERPFRVTESTIIHSEYDKPITFADIPIPCTATIEYRLIMDQDPECLKIKVESTLPARGRR